MMIIYKLIRQDRTTRDGFRYPPKGSRLPELDGIGELCSGHWYHGYAHPLLAVLHAPIHVDSDYTKMIEIEVPEVYAPSQMKLGFTTGIVGGVIPLPKITGEQRTRYGIGCVCSIYKDKFYRKWADDWISGKDRTKATAWATAWAAWTSARAAGVAWAAARVAWANDWIFGKDGTSWAVAGVVAEAAEEAAGKDLDLIRVWERPRPHPRR